MKRTTHKQLQAKIRARRSRKSTLQWTGAVQTYVALITLIGLLFTMLPEALFASSWSPTLLVNTEAFHVIDDSNATANIEMRFGDTIQEKLIYNRAGSFFKLTRGLVVAGNLSATGSITASGMIRTIGTISGTSLVIDRNGSFSGNLNIKGTTRLQSGAVISRAQDTPFITLNDTTNSKSVGVHTGSGSPEGIVTAGPGSMYSDHFGGRIYKKNSGTGNTGWTELFSGSGSVHMAKMRRNAAQTINTTSTTKMYLDTEEFDVGDIANITPGTSGSGRITIKKAGKYMVNASWWSQAVMDDGEYIATYIYKNGGAILQHNNISPGTNQNLHGSVFDVVDLVAGDYIEMYVWHNEGASFSTFTTQYLTPRLSVVQLQDNQGSNFWTMSGSNLYNNNSGNVGIGAGTTPRTKLEVFGAISGATINATTLLTGGTLQGFGLYNCNGTSNKLTYNSTTKKFLCEADQSGGGSNTGFNSGQVLTIGDARYVKKQGDTMTGALNINITNGTLGSMGLKVLNTLSGAIVHGEKDLTSSGSLTVKNSAKFQSGVVVSRAQDTPFITLNDTTNSKSVGVHTGSGSPEGIVTAGPGSLYSDNLGGKIYKKNSGTGNSGWVELVSGSGSVHMAKINRTAVQTMPTGWQKLYFDTEEFDVGGIANVTAGASGSGRITIKHAGKYLISAGMGLQGFDLGQSLAMTIMRNGYAPATFAKIVTSYSATSNQELRTEITEILDLAVGEYVEIAIYQTSGSPQSTLTQSYNKPRFAVVQLQDNQGSNFWTMSGSNLYNNNAGNIGIGAGTPARTKLEVFGAISGSSLRLSGPAAIHGTLAATGSVRTDGDLTLNDDAGATDAVLTFGNATANQTLKYLNSAQKFQFSKAVSVIGNLSGSSLTIDGNASFSGNVLAKNTLTVKGTISGATINATTLLTGGTLQGFGLYNCNGTSNKLTYNSTTKKFLCEADQAGSSNSGFNSGQVMNIGDSRYVNVAGDTMTGALTINIQNGTQGSIGLKLVNTLTGAVLHAEKAITSSGSIHLESSYSRGSGALTVIKNGPVNNLIQIPEPTTDFGTGVYVTTSGAALIALDSQGNDSRTPHLLFGYKGTFDTSLFRSAVQTLQTMGNFFASGTLSGSTIKALHDISASGSVFIENGLFGNTINGFGLTDCDNAAINSILWDDSTNQFSCGTSIGGPGGGLEYSTAEGIFVNQGGDTMTGGLNIFAQSITGSASLVISNSIAAATGAYIGSTAGGPLLALDHNQQGAEAAQNPHLLFGYRGNFDTSLFRSAAQTLKTLGNFFALGTISGAVLHADNDLTSSGTLNVKASARFQSGVIISRAQDTPSITLRDTTNSKSVGVHTGSGSPEGIVTASPGSLYSDNFNGRLYKKNSGTGNTDWRELLTTGTGSMHMAKMTRNSAQSLTTGVVQKIHFDTEEFDVGDIANVAVSSTGSGRITIKKAGKYLVTGNWYIGCASYNSLTYLFKNGAAVTTVATNLDASSLQLNNFTITDVLDLNVNDRLELFALHNAITCDTDTSVAYRPRLSVIQLQDNLGTNFWTMSGSTIFNSNAGNVGIGLSKPKTKLDVLGTISGSTLHASNRLASSGVLVVRPGGNANPSLYANGTQKVGVNTASPHSSFTSSGTFATSVRIATATGSINGGDQIIFASGSSMITLTLPTAVGIPGRQYTIKKTSSTTATNMRPVVIATTSSQTIDRVSSWRLLNRGQQLTVISDGANWQVIDASSYGLNGGYVSMGTTMNQWYSSPADATALTTATLTTTATIRAFPFIAQKVMTINGMAVSIQTTAASAQVRLGIYRDSGNGYPDQLVVDAGTVTTTSTGVRSICPSGCTTTGDSTLPVHIQPGLYWLAINNNSIAHTHRGFAVANMNPVSGFPSNYTTLRNVGWSVSSSYAAFPSTFPTAATAVTAVPIPAITVRIQE